MFVFMLRGLLSLIAAQAAYARRGAPWTFNAQAFVDAVRRIKQQGKAMLPSFDHGVGDPIENDIMIDAAKHSVVLVRSRLHPLCKIVVHSSAQFSTAWVAMWQQRQHYSWCHSTASKGGWCTLIGMWGQACLSNNAVDGM
jgi:hypothetical protein